MSFWIAISVGAACGLFSLWLWIFGHSWAVRHWNVLRDGPAIPTPAATRTKAILWACGGFVATVLMLLVSMGDRTVLLETEAPGSVGLEPGGKANVTKIPFVVEHPGVKHKLLIWPKEGDDAALARKDWGNVTFVVAVLGADGRQDFGEQVTAKSGKVGETYFVPSQAGPHALAVAVTSLKIPKIHVLVYDPKKKDGKRMKGY